MASSKSAASGDPFPPVPGPGLLAVSRAASAAGGQGRQQGLAALFGQGRVGDRGDPSPGLPMAGGQGIAHWPRLRLGGACLACRSTEGLSTEQAFAQGPSGHRPGLWACVLFSCVLGVGSRPGRKAGPGAFHKFRENRPQATAGPVGRRPRAALASSSSRGCGQGGGHFGLSGPKKSAVWETFGAGLGIPGSGACAQVLGRGLSRGRGLGRFDGVQTARARTGFQVRAGLYLGRFRGRGQVPRRPGHRSRESRVASRRSGPGVSAKPLPPWGLRAWRGKLFPPGRPNPLQVLSGRRDKGRGENIRHPVFRVPVRARAPWPSGMSLSRASRSMAEAVVAHVTASAPGPATASHRPGRATLGRLLPGAGHDRPSSGPHSRWLRSGRAGGGRTLPASSPEAGIQWPRRVGRPGLGAQFRRCKRPRGPPDSRCHPPGRARRFGARPPVSKSRSGQSIAVIGRQLPGSGWRRLGVRCRWTNRPARPNPIRTDP